MRFPTSPLLPVVLWGLSGCANPITNLPFYEDAELVAALPSEDRLGAPSEVRLARVGTSILLADAVAASAEYQDHVETLLRSGEALRAAEPDVRSEVSRSWDAAQAAGDLGGDRYTWWVRGEVVRVAEGGDATWTIEASAKESGPYVPVGDGRHDPAGYGDAHWDLVAMVEVLTGEPVPSGDDVAELVVDYDDAVDGEGVREVVVDHTRGSELLDRWSVAGDIALGWFGPSTLTEPPRPGAFQVLVSGIGGWGVGELYDGDDTLDAATCWSGVGDTLYAAGLAYDPSLGAVQPAVGTDGACTTDYPF